MAAALEPIGVTLKMGTIFDLLCRSVLVVRADRDRVAREGCGAVRVRAAVQRKGAGGR